MTLIKLTVVLLILVALAGLAIPYFGGTNRKALCNVTDITMANVKREIMDRYYLDTLGKFPQDLDGLTANGIPSYNLHYLFSNSNLAASRTHKPFDPGTATGWRSCGYLQSGLSGTFANTTYTDPFLANHIVTLDRLGQFFYKYLLGLGLDNAAIETAIGSSRPASSDDRILYFNAATPVSEVNTPCE